MFGVYWREDLSEVGTRLMDLLDATELSCLSKIAIVVGGDGTLLEAIHKYPCVLDKVVVHIGAGRVNFYHTVKLGEMSLEEIANRIKGGDFKLVEFNTLFSEGCTAINEVVIKGVDPGRLLAFRIRAGELAVGGRADGVVVSTSQGTTGYVLSNYGPVVDYRIRAMTIAFIAPFTLHLRPYVIPPSEVVVETRQNARAFCDGLYLSEGREFKISPGDKKLKLAIFDKYDFYNRVKKRMTAK